MPVPGSFKVWSQVLSRGYPSPKQIFLVPPSSTGVGYLQARTGLGYPPPTPEQVTLWVVCLVRFPVKRLFVPVVREILSKFVQKAIVSG